MTTRKSKNTFFGITLPRGIFYNKFRAGNKPNEKTFKELADSLPFINDVSDAAKVDESGHIRLATDEEVVDRTASWSDGNPRAVQPHQIPESSSAPLLYDYIIDVNGTGDYTNLNVGLNAISTYKTVFVKRGTYVLTGFCLIKAGVTIHFEDVSIDFGNYYMISTGNYSTLIGNVTIVNNSGTTSAFIQMASSYLNWANCCFRFDAIAVTKQIFLSCSGSYNSFNFICRDTTNNINVDNSGCIVIAGNANTAKIIGDGYTESNDKADCYFLRITGDYNLVHIISLGANTVGSNDMTAIDLTGDSNSIIGIARNNDIDSADSGSSNSRATLIV